LSAAEVKKERKGRSKEEREREERKIKIYSV
jgi:hypothetical protein